MVEWLLNGETGISSETLLGFYLGIPKREPRHPGDEHDMRRCILLVEACPEVRQCFPELAKAMPRWKPILENWEALVTEFRTHGFHPMGDLLRKLTR